MQNIRKCDTKCKTGLFHMGDYYYLTWTKGGCDVLSSLLFLVSYSLPLFLAFGERRALLLPPCFDLAVIIYRQEALDWVR